VSLAFLTIGMLFGALWAKEAWGHYWSCVGGASIIFPPPKVQVYILIAQASKIVKYLLKNLQHY